MSPFPPESWRDITCLHPGKSTQMLEGRRILPSSTCVANDGECGFECGFAVGHICDPDTQDATHRGRGRGREGVLVHACHSLSLAMQQELTQPSWPFIRVTQAPLFRNSPVWTFQIFMFLSQELVHKKWPLEVKQQSEMALECALKHRWGCMLTRHSR